jgi:hypothetical protein
MNINEEIREDLMRRQELFEMAMKIADRHNGTAPITIHPDMVTWRLIKKEMSKVVKRLERNGVDYYSKEEGQFKNKAKV